jgi:hypothetical protein
MAKGGASGKAGVAAKLRTAALYVRKVPMFALVQHKELFRAPESWNDLAGTYHEHCL